MVRMQNAEQWYYAGYTDAELEKRVVNLREWSQSAWSVSGAQRHMKTSDSHVTTCLPVDRGCEPNRSAKL